MILTGLKFLKTLEIEVNILNNTPINLVGIIEDIIIEKGKEMKVITTKTKVYEFDELSEEAKEKAILDHINFLLEVTPYEEAEGNFKKAIDKAEEMFTPWFTGSYVYDYCKEEIIEQIKINEYVFTADGAFFSQ